MKFLLSVTLALAALFLLTGAQAQRERLSLDRNWRFHLGHATDPDKDFGFRTTTNYAKTGEGAGPIRPDFSDGRWRTVNLPHDWAIELPFEREGAGDLNGHGYRPVGGGKPATSVGWYRRTFTIPASDTGRRLRVVFDGVFRDAQVWLNGCYLGRHESGYTGFSFDITELARYGAKNVLTVRVDASQYEGWFYEGAGIYRHVWLLKNDPVHVTENGLFVTADLKGDHADVTAQAEIVNEQTDMASVFLTTTLYDADGRSLATVKTPFQPFSPGDTKTLTTHLALPSPRLWSPETPTLYHVVVTIGAANVHLRRGLRVVDTAEAPLGVRTVRFDPDKGLLLNGKPVKIKGTCNHQDHAGVGSALPDRIQYYRIERLKAMGCNAYRTSHNEPTAELLDACDKLGMLVLDETRSFGSSAYDLEQLTHLVRRDRNHPAVIFYSIANEEPLQTSKEAAAMAQAMIRTVRHLDPTRVTTAAVNNGNEYQGVNEAVDVRGINYAFGEADDYHKAHPQQPVHGSEAASTVSTRGIYANDRERGYVSAYDVNQPGWGQTAEEFWSFADARPWFAGGFIWTGFDYRGEPTPYGWPCINSHFGIMDTCGFPKDNFYYYRAWWSGEPTTHLFPHWNWKGKEGQPIDVWVHSNADEVELLQDGKSLGRQKVERDRHLAWKVNYAPGRLEAVAYRNGKAAEHDTVETTGEPVKLVLTPDRPTINADGEDVAMVTVSATDAQGRAVPTANLPVSFTIEGAGKLLGVGNGDPSCHEPDVFIEEPTSKPLSEWKYRVVEGGLDNRPEVAPDAADAGWETVGVEKTPNLPVGATAVLRTTLDLTETDLQTNAWRYLDIGQIDDIGRVYVNGQKVAETDDWRQTWHFDIGKLLKPGKNVFAIVLKNTDGPGGLTGGVSLVGHARSAQWSRSLFNGLAQAIVQSGDEAGTITLIASSPGLEPARLTITTRAVTPRPRVP